MGIGRSVPELSDYRSFHFIVAGEKEGIAVNQIKLRFDWTIAACILLSFSLLLKLGYWQLDRAQEKRIYNQAMNIKLQAAPVALASIVVTDSVAIDYTNVSLHGAFINEKMFVIANQYYRGQPGIEVIIPVQREDIDELVLVSRGWLPAPLEIDSAFMQGLKVDGAPLLSASVHAAGGRSFFTESALRTNRWPIRLHHVNIKHLSHLFDKPVFPYLLRLHKDSPAVLQRNHPMKLLNPATNMSYARQWFGMSILLLVVSLLASSNIMSIFRGNESK